MRIVQQDYARLVIELRPTGLLVLCIGMFVLFFMLGFGLNSFLPFVIGLAGLPGAQALDDLPRIPGMTFLGLASFVPLAVAVLFLRTRSVEFNRTAGTVVVDNRQLLRRGAKTYPLSTLQGAVVLTVRAQDGRVAHRAALRFAGNTGTVALTPYFTAGNGPERTAATINSWLGEVPDS